MTVRYVKSSPYFSFKLTLAILLLAEAARFGPAGELARRRAATAGPALPGQPGASVVQSEVNRDNRNQ